jgi:hypothetical protein
MKALSIVLRTLAISVTSIAAVLATAAGALAAVSWACRAVGGVPVALVGAFFAGAALTSAVERARAARGSSEPSSGREH